MPAQELHVVTGAFGYSGKYLAARLLQAGHRVRTLTNSIDRPVAVCAGAGRKAEILRDLPANEC